MFGRKNASTVSLHCSTKQANQQGQLLLLDFMRLSLGVGQLCGEAEAEAEALPTLGLLTQLWNARNLCMQHMHCVV